MMMPEDVLAEMPSTGMTPKEPHECLELLRLCSVMNWKPKLPLNIMRDDSAGRWFMRGKPGEQDYWIRDHDIEILKRTPMWASVQVAQPYGINEETKIRPAAVTATEISMRERASWEKLAKISEYFKIGSKEEIYKAMIEGLPLPPTPDDMREAVSKIGKITGIPADYIIVDDPFADDPVTRDKHNAAAMREAAEAKLKRIDEEWE